MEELFFEIGNLPLLNELVNEFAGSAGVKSATDRFDPVLLCVEFVLRVLNDLCIFWVLCIIYGMPKLDQIS